MKNVHICGWLLAMLVLVGCKRGNLYLDNAGNQLLYVKLNRQEYVLEPFAGMMVEANKGNYSLTVSNSQRQKLYDTLFYLSKSGGLINLARSPYIKWRELYGDEKYRQSQLNKDTVEIGTWIFYGDFQLLDSTKVFYDKTWNYDLDQTFPIDKVGWDPPGADRFIIESKIYRLNDFVEEMKKKKK